MVYDKPVTVVVSFLIEIIHKNSLLNMKIVESVYLGLMAHLTSVCTWQSLTSTQASRSELKRYIVLESGVCMFSQCTTGPLWEVLLSFYAYICIICKFLWLKALIWEQDLMSYSLILHPLIWFVVYKPCIWCRVC